LTQTGKTVGLVDSKRWQRYQKKLSDIEKLKNYLTSTKSDGTTLWDYLRRPVNNLASSLPDNEYVQKEHFDKEVLEAVIIDAKYVGYLEKQNKLAAAFSDLEKKKLPTELDYYGIEHLRAEAREKLSAFRPANLGQAARIGGITPADITVIQVYMKKYFKTI
jgi:tRNA uridine 5-carboxymethylaminomethyl modification enzyme